VTPSLHGGVVSDPVKHREDRPASQVMLHKTHERSNVKQPSDNATSAPQARFHNFWDGIRRASTSRLLSVMQSAYSSAVRSASLYSELRA